MNFELNKEYLLDAQLTKVTLVGIQAERIDEDFSVEELEIGVSIAVATKIIEDRSDIGYSRLTVEFGKEDETPVYAKVVYNGEFTFSEEVPTEKMENVLEIVGLKSLWPYVRAMLSKITSDMDIPTYILPTLDIIKMIGEDEI